MRRRVLHSREQHCSKLRLVTQCETTTMPVLRRKPFLRMAVIGVAAAGTLTVAAVTGSVASASTTTTAVSNATAAARGAAGPVFDCLTLASPTCYSPRQFRTAYGIQPLTARGITGRGETVVLPEFAATPGEDGVTDVRQDLARYDSVFGLPAARLRVITTLAPDASPVSGAWRVLRGRRDRARDRAAGRHPGNPDPCRCFSRAGGAGLQCGATHGGVPGRRGVDHPGRVQRELPYLRAGDDHPLGARVRPPTARHGSRRVG